MKNSSICLIFIIIMFSFNDISIAQWLKTSGPTSSNISCFARIGSNIFVGTAGDGIFKSTNNGDNWNALNNGLTYYDPTYYHSMDINRIIASQSNLFTQFSYHDPWNSISSTIFLSTDDGNSWKEVKNGLPQWGVNDIAVIGSNIYVCNSNGIYFSTNNGSSWNLQDNVLKGKYVQALGTYSDGSGGYKLYAAVYNKSLFVSSDNGANWTDLNAPIESSPKFVINGNSILISCGPTILYSSNSGNTWKNITPIYPHSPSFYNPVAICPNESSGIILIVGSDQDGIYISTDSGTSWTLSNTGMSCLGVKSLFVESTGGNSIIFAGTRGGVFKSTNFGFTWSQFNSGFVDQYINAFAIKDNNLYAGAGNGGIYRSTNYGTNWTQINDNTNVFPITAISITNANSIFASTTQGTYRSTDNGTTWTNLDYIKIDGINYSTGIASAVWSLANIPTGINDTKIFAGTLNDGILLSINNGNHWNPLNNGLWNDPRNYIVYALAISTDGISDAIIYAGMGHQGLKEYGSVYCSTDFGSSWAEIKNGLPNTAIWALVKSNTYLYAGTNGEGVFCSTNNGANWKAVNEGLTNKVISSFAVSGKYLFAGSYDGGVFRSSNNGTSWVQINENLNNLSINALTLDGINLYAGTVGGGVWKRPLSEITSVDREVFEIPKQFILEQNYPNPFNPSTTIKFLIPTANYVTLTIFNSLGQEVGKLVSQNMSAGTYTAEWNASSFAGGVYFYRMQAGDFVNTKKLILLK